MTTLAKKKTKKKTKKKRPISPNRMKYNRLHGVLSPPKIRIDTTHNPAWYQTLSIGSQVIATHDLASETDVEAGELGIVKQLLRDDETNEVVKIKVYFTPSLETVPFEAGEHPIGDELRLVKI